MESPPSPAFDGDKILSVRTQYLSMPNTQTFSNLQEFGNIPITRLWLVPVRGWGMGRVDPLFP